MAPKDLWLKGRDTHSMAPHTAPLIGQRIQDLVHQLDPAYSLDPAAQEQVLQLADDFMDKVCKQSLRVAQHRGSKTLDVQDVQLVLAKQWGIVVPGMGPPMPRKPKSSNSATGRGSVASGGGGSGASGGNKRKLSAATSGAQRANK